VVRSFVVCCCVCCSPIFLFAFFLGRFLVVAVPYIENILIDTTTTFRCFVICWMVFSTIPQICIATPKSIQSLAYLLRNEILDNLDNLRAELQYQLQQQQQQKSSSSTTTSNDDDDNVEDIEEVRQLITAAYTSMQKYLEIIPPNELQMARELIKQQQQQK
jgi:hypothetical protein